MLVSPRSRGRSALRGANRGLDKLRASCRGVYPRPFAPSQLRGSHRTSVLLHQGQEKVPLPAGLPPGGRLSAASQACGLAWVGAPGKAALPPCIDSRGCPWATHGSSVLCSQDRKGAWGGRAAGAGAAGAPVLLGAQAVWAHSPPTCFLPELHGGRQAGCVTPGWSHSQEEPRVACRAWGNQRLGRGEVQKGSAWAEGAQVGVRGAQWQESRLHALEGAPLGTPLCADVTPAPAQRSSAARGTTTGPAVGVEGGEGPSPSAWSLGGFVQWVVPL